MRAVLSALDPQLEPRALHEKALWFDSGERVELPELGPGLDELPIEDTTLEELEPEDRCETEEASRGSLLRLAARAVPSVPEEELPETLVSLEPERTSGAISRPGAARAEVGGRVGRPHLTVVRVADTWVDAEEDLRAPPHPPEPRPNGPATHPLPPFRGSILPPVGVDLAALDTGLVLGVRSRHRGRLARPSWVRWAAWGAGFAATFSTGALSSTLVVALGVLAAWV